jgi:hypothetical protein
MTQVYIFLPLSDADDRKGYKGWAFQNVDSHRQEEISAGRTTD